MGKLFCRTLVLAVFVGMFFMLEVKNDASAGVQVDVNIGLPAPFVFHAPPPLVAIPGTYAYLVPDVDVSVLFYHGFWYRPHHGHWYRAHSYNGPWVSIGPRHVPRALTKLPSHYRSVPHGYHRIPYKKVEKNWGRWERERHWERDKKWRGGRERDGRKGRVEVKQRGKGNGKHERGKRSDGHERRGGSWK